ncbi:Golgi phosphoprotein 3 GPP34 [Streptomyces sp. SLBN-118]|uniref:GOLPH3/VPS74 family protein n=1 Tax=Streptomyces sp. SLBN-118 TaxID=2768454 RepID=UPI001152B4C0|nr:GPP34 family phosphoprotein [Streptomyces sp. SLBN-118]TQK42711.1 Golgi phosphoprotein 3 GPP34 [Streptomyces sp. SLBN-118]
MTTPRDLLIIAIDRASGHPVEQGDLSLALAGAEVIDLLGAEAIRLDDDRIVPGLRPALPDRLLDEAASSLAVEAPYESVDDWLWRRGRGLSAAYLAALEAEGQLFRPRRHRWLPSGNSRTELVDSPTRRRAAERWTSGEPVLGALAAAVGVRDERTADAPGLSDDAVARVLGAVHDAVSELAGERQRRAIEDAAFDNVWRGD